MTAILKTFMATAALAAAVASCCQSGEQLAPAPDWTEYESGVIASADSIMRVLTVDDPSDSLLLRTASDTLSGVDIASDTYKRLAELMLATVTHPSQDGVGIAGPQVGILRRVVAVMRYDKEGTPFEVYPNIRITAMRGEAQPGPEGCLSVPGRRGDVLRFRDIDIAYTSPKTLADTTETVADYTAIIFQHECDHLDGVIYTDKLVQTTE